jgi:nitrogen fixation protein NifQ
MNAPAEISSMAFPEHWISLTAGCDANDVEPRSNQVNGRLLAQLVNGQRHGRGCLPFCLGLKPLDFVWLLQSHFEECPSLPEIMDISLPQNSQAVEAGRLRQELLEMRRDEWQEIRDLLLAGRAGENSFEIPLADIVAAGCLGGDHLWRDLGLQTRNELTELMARNFPQLSARNVADMKWKKFFYKQLCEQEGGYVCRAPTCEQCAAYDDCFGPEE